MPAKSVLRCAYGGFVGAIFAGSISATRAQEAAKTPVPQKPDVLVAGPPTQTILLRSGMSRSITVQRAFKTIYITNPDVVDVVARTDHTAILVPKNVGATNIDVVDEQAQVINTVNVVVDNFPGYGRVQVYNKASPNSFTSFQCGDVVCQSVGVDVEEPSRPSQGQGPSPGMGPSPNTSTQ